LFKHKRCLERKKLKKERPSFPWRGKPKKRGAQKKGGVRDGQQKSREVHCIGKRTLGTGTGERQKECQAASLKAEYQRKDQEAREDLKP